MQFVDTHCHIHFPDYELEPETVITAANEIGVTKLMCVGCTLPDSRLAIEMASRHDNIWATIGLHPHEGSVYVNDDKSLQEFRDLATKPKVVAIGETGLDYHYMHSSAQDQKKLLRFQIDLALEKNLPLIFHIREAFDDFWTIFDEYRGLRGVVHSFSSGTQDLENALSRGLYIGLNGIMTFTKSQEQLEAAKKVPLGRLLLETDAPFLTPTPFRGTICEPKYVQVTAEFLSKLRGESLGLIASSTTKNAQKLFGLN
ncbi:MAG TPA: TatD family hydrolase [Patescibacteria group bacterium]|nr:TatD family hydrolase [Patescibacteria group bacterium]